MTLNEKADRVDNLIKTKRELEREIENLTNAIAKPESEIRISMGTTWGE